MVDRPDELIPTSVTDFLDHDPPIRGQKYACISFVSPEDTLADKDVFILSKFMEGIAQDIKVCLDSLPSSETARLVKERFSYLWSPGDMQSEFNAYRGVRQSELDEEFRKTHGVFTTSIRGFKIRGVYDTIEDAKIRAHSIKKMDDKFNVYISEVGCWCPWSPNPETISEVEYAETQLNTLMNSYKEGQNNKDDLYNARKMELIGKMNDDREIWIEQQRNKMVGPQPPLATEPLVEEAEESLAQQPPVATEPLVEVEESVAQQPPMATEPLAEEEEAGAQQPPMATEPLEEEEAGAQQPPVATEVLPHTPRGCQLA